METPDDNMSSETVSITEFSPGQDTDNENQGLTPTSRAFLQEQMRAKRGGLPPSVPAPVPETPKPDKANKMTAQEAFEELNTPYLTRSPRAEAVATASEPRITQEPAQFPVQSNRPMGQTARVPGDAGDEEVERVSEEQGPRDTSELEVAGPEPDEAPKSIGKKFKRTFSKCFC